MPNQYSPLIERFNQSFIPEPNSGCWLWTGAASRSNKSGTDYRPTIMRGGKVNRAYRISYEIHHGPIPEGKMICHHCDVPICVNPDHLYAGSALENAADCIARGRHMAQTNPEAARLRGHVLGRSNTWTAGRKGKSVIPHAEIPSIRARLVAGSSLAQEGERYGVSKQAVRQFLTRDAARAALKLARGEP